MSEIPGNGSSGDLNTINDHEESVNHLALLRNIEIDLEEQMAICRVAAIAYSYNMVTPRSDQAQTGRFDRLASSLDILIFDNQWIGYTFETGLSSAMRSLFESYDRNNRIFGISQRTPVTERYGPFGRVRILRVSHMITEYIDGHEYVDYIENWLYDIIAIRMRDVDSSHQSVMRSGRWVDTPGGRMLLYSMDEEDEEEI